MKIWQKNLGIKIYKHIYKKKQEPRKKYFHFVKLTDLLLFKTRFLKTELTYMRLVVILQYHAQQQ